MTVSLRDVRTRHTLNFNEDLPVLRVSNDLETARDAGPWYLDRGYARLGHGSNGSKISAAREDRLARCTPGEMVLAHLPDFDPTIDYDPNAWWLCEVTAVDGDDAS